jgi:hypothetical protein
LSSGDHFHEPVDHISAHELLLLMLDETRLDLGRSHVRRVNFLEIIGHNGVLCLDDKI